MSNETAYYWKTVVYQEISICNTAVTDLSEEKERLRTLIDSMIKVKEVYKENIGFVKVSLAQMDNQVKIKIRKAKDLLVENYYGNTPEVIKSRDNVQKSNESINSARNRISSLQRIYEANVEHINQLIKIYTEEKEEVELQLDRAINERNILYNRGIS